MLLNTENIALLRSLLILCLFFTLGENYHFLDNFSSKMATFSARNTNIHKISI